MRKTCLFKNPKDLGGRLIKNRRIFSKTLLNCVHNQIDINLTCSTGVYILATRACGKHLLVFEGDNETNEMNELGETFVLFHEYDWKEDMCPVLGI